MKIVEVEKLTKRFDDFTAVDGISFHLQEGEILGFLGPNGAGKTTTLQMLLGVLTPTSGKIAYFGKSLIKHREEIMEQVNFSTTYTNLPWDLSVKENLTFISHLYMIKNRKTRVAEIIDTFKLQKLQNQRMSELSAGQLTRVNLAKAFLNYPKVLLLDEPTASLDPDIAQYIREFLQEERKNFQVSIVFTSHNMSEVEEICDRVIFVDKGKIVANDTPDQLAKSIMVCHVSMQIVDGLKRLIEYCQKNNITYKLHGRYIIVDNEEQQIPEFLSQLPKIGVHYTEISIEKPSLEDYFLQVITKGK